MYNIYDELNKVIDYIEKHILEEIDINILSKMTGLNINNLKSIFYCLTGVTINEYIRFRRLSLSVSDILNGESITSISYKYLYNSPSSYNRAFKKYEGITPRNLKNKNYDLKLFNKIVFKENIMDYNIEYRIYKNKGFNLYGISKQIDLKNKYKEIPDFWNEVKNNNKEFLDNIRYGFLNENKYYCLMEKEFNNSEKITIPSHNYFVIKTFDFNSKNIIKNIKKGLNEYIKSLNYKRLNLPNIEIYYKDYMEILIPIT